MCGQSWRAIIYIYILNVLKEKKINITIQKCNLEVYRLFIISYD